MNKILYEEISKYEPFDDKEKLDKEVILDYIKNNEDVLTRNNKIKLDPGSFATLTFIFFVTPPDSIVRVAVLPAATS